MSDYGPDSSLEALGKEVDEWKERALAAEKELAGLRVLAAEPHAIQKVRDTLGPLSLWSQEGMERHVAEKIKEALATRPEELPLEPTKAMIDAMLAAFYESTCFDDIPFDSATDTARDAYRRMLAASRLPQKDDA